MMRKLTPRQRALLPCLALWAVMLAVHLHLTYIPGDAAHYRAAMAGPWDLAGAFLSNWKEYATWSSRVLINTLCSLFSAWPAMVWRLVDPAVAALAAWGVGYALRQEEAPAGMGLICFLFYLYQWQYLSDAGWAVTTITYLWPAAMGVWALMGLWRTLRGQSTSAGGWAACTALLLFAANMEQAALVLLCLLAAGIGALLFRRDRVPAMLWVQLALTVGSLVFIFACPGNAARTAGDITSFYMDFRMLSPLQKAEIGLSGAISANVFGRDSVFFLFAVLVALANRVRRAPLPARLCSLVPCVLLLPFSMLRYQAKALVPGIANITEAYSAAGYINLTNFGAPQSYVPLLLGYGIFALCLLGVVGAFGWGRTTLCVWALLALGGMSQAAMGFTPSVGVSSRRTGFCFSVCIIAACGVLWQALGKKPLPTRAEKIAFGAVCAALGAVQAVYLWQL